MSAYGMFRAMAILIAVAPVVSFSAVAQQPAAAPAAADPAPGAAQTPAAPQPAAPPAASAPLMAPVIIVVDVEGIMTVSKAAKAIDSQIEAQRQIFQKDVAKREGDLHNAEQDLAKQQSVLAADIFDQRRKDFQQRVAEFQRDVAGKRRSLEVSFNDARGKVQAVLFDIVKQIASESGANMVLPKSQVVLFANSMDKSEEALRRLDQKMPTVSVVIAKATPDPAVAGGALAPAANPAPAAAPAKTPAKPKP
ncbi:MAG TPA: OmpH family outer membrane protein [Stellaceae bacterium]|nr:OmpH family outer membrane protein [Stellaceae bacterium]